MHNTTVRLALAFSLIAMSAGGQVTTDPRIAAIRTRFAEINAETPSYRRVSADMDSLGFERRSTDGGEVVAYFRARELKRATATYVGEHGSLVSDIYYSAERPEFVYVVERSSGEKLYGPQHVVREQRIYFSNDSLIRYMVGQAVRPLKSGESVKAAREYRGVALQILRAVK